MASVAVDNSNTSLTVFNLPYSLKENEIHSMFPAAQYANLLRNPDDPSRSRGICVLQFNNRRDCQDAYDECQGGMEVQGRAIRADFGNDTNPRNQRPSFGGRGGRGGGSQGYHQQQQSRPRYEQPDSAQGRNNDRTLTVSNLPYSATERDIRREFPEATRVEMTLNEEGRSRGVAQLTFNGTDECQTAMNECNYKTLGGRPMRARIMRDGDSSNQRYDQDNRYGGRQMDYAPRRGGDRPSRFGSGGPGRWAPREYGRNNNGRPDMGQRRDRSPVRGEPVRGYGDVKGPRITSAVIRHQGERSPSGSASASD